MANCHPDDGAPGTGSDSCEDIDDDGDGTPHDQGEEHHQGDHGDTVDDDDGDGIPNERDCDHRHGGDDDPADLDTGDDNGSDGSGHA
jgi:hypothetical protein